MSALLTVSRLKASDITDPECDDCNAGYCAANPEQDTKQ